MRTALSGTLSMRSFVASSPSMPGMRTSMITTSGRRRSASATALSPSPASPITRMWGARERERRRPSRTTSWSSTIRQVISELATGRRSIVCRFLDDLVTRGRLDGQAELLGIRRGTEAQGAPVADAERPDEAAHVLAHGLHLGGGQVGAPSVELLVVRQELRPVVLELREEVLARPRPEVEEVRPD